MKSSFKYISLICRIIVGVVFIYSGFVKGVDPLGSTYKFNDYFNAFNANWATTFSFGLSFVLSLAEFIVGFCILLNLKIKLSSLGAVLFMAIFTPLTLVLALTNPVHDCGCFGDALILTNWQTFWKNIVLLIPTIYLFINRKKITSTYSNTDQWLAITFGTITMIIVSIYSYQHLPVLDFRPYKVGTHIPEAMTTPEGAPADIWESKFIYSKKNREKTFTMKKLPDSTWTFVSAKHELIKKGYEPPIHDFTIVDNEGTELTDIILSNENYNFLLIAYNLEKADLSKSKEINKLYDFCYENGYPFYALSASTDAAINEYYKSTKASYDFYTTDEITLKTIIRSNPGLLIIKEGTIIGKWHVNDLPSPEYLGKNILKQTISNYKKTADKYYIYTLILLCSFLISSYVLVKQKIKKP
ncbi:MAG: DoxX family protein [Salinivirgaceae bacterium]|nr:DoxX family protein [Salinivirgaceae bacterium]